MKKELKSKIQNDKYTEYIYEKFDIQNRVDTIEVIEYDLKLINNFDWNIGIIYGGSGTGKTTILKTIGELSSSEFDHEKSLISNFDWLEPKDATYLLSSMGLSSVPTWLRPFHLLSNGEQYRAELAYKVASSKAGDTILIDEYTSVVDRDVAKAMSFALQKYIRKANKKIILASCHYDIMEWLMPDWTCSPQKGGKVEKASYRQQGRPKIGLQVSRVEHDTWKLFKKHHYMSEDVNKSCMFFLFEWNNKPIAINCVISQPSGSIKNGFRESRIVVLPDFQGLSIGSSISDFTAAIYKNNKCRYFTKTVHPTLGLNRNISTKWKPTSKNEKIRNDIKNGDSMKYKKTLDRLSYCHEYIGDKIKGYESLLLPIEIMRDRKIKSEMYSLF